MKLLSVLLLAFVLSLGIACGEPSFEDAVATRVAETNIAAAAAAHVAVLNVSAWAEVEAIAAVQELLNDRGVTNRMGSREYVYDSCLAMVQHYADRWEADFDEQSGWVVRAVRAGSEYEWRIHTTGAIAAISSPC